MLDIFTYSFVKLVSQTVSKMSQMEGTSFLLLFHTIAPAGCDAPNFSSRLCCVKIFRCDTPECNNA